MRARSWRFSARSRSACVSIRRRLPAGRRRPSPPPTCARLRDGVSRSGRSPSPTTIVTRATLTAWVAPAAVSSDSLLGGRRSAERGADHRRALRRGWPLRRRRRRSGNRRRRPQRHRRDRARSVGDRSAASLTANFSVTEFRRQTSGGILRTSTFRLHTSNFCVCGGSVSALHRTAMPSLQGPVSGRGRFTSATDVSVRSSRSTTTASIHLTRERSWNVVPRISGAIASCCRLPVSRCTGFNSGFTPLVRCTRLADRLGVSELYIKDDSVNHPTLSYKDRVVSVAATRAVELGFKVLACASTGQSGQQRRGSRRPARHRVLRRDPGQPRGRQAARLRHLQPDAARDRRQLRRCEPAVHADRGSLRVGLRQHQPARRTTRKARRRWDSRSSNSLAGSIRSISCRRSPAVRCCRASCADCASSGDRTRRRASCLACMPPRRRGARRSCTRWSTGSNIRNRCARTPSRSRSRSGIPRTAIR